MGNVHLFGDLYKKRNFHIQNQNSPWLWRLALLSRLHLYKCTLHLCTFSPSSAATAPRALPRWKKGRRTTAMSTKGFSNSQITIYGVRETHLLVFGNRKRHLMVVKNGSCDGPPQERWRIHRKMGEIQPPFPDAHTILETANGCNYISKETNLK